MKHMLLYIKAMLKTNERHCPHQVITRSPQLDHRHKYLLQHSTRAYNCHHMSKHLLWLVAYCSMTIRARASCSCLSLSRISYYCLYCLCCLRCRLWYESAANVYIVSPYSKFWIVCAILIQSSLNTSLQCPFFRCQIT